MTCVGSRHPYPNLEIVFQEQSYSDSNIDHIRIQLSPTEEKFWNLLAPLEFFFQEQSYSSLHSGRRLAWDHVHGDIDDPCGAIANFCGVIADFCGVIADPCGPMARRDPKHRPTISADPCGPVFGAATSTIVRRSFDATISVIDAETSSLGAATSAIAWSYRRYRRLRSWYNSADV